VDIAQVVRRELTLDRAQIHRLWARKVKTTLDTAVEDYAVEIGVFLVDGRGPGEDALEVCDVEGGAGGFGVAVFLDELVDGFGAAAGDDDLATFGDELFCEALTDA